MDGGAALMKASWVVAVEFCRIETVVRLFPRPYGRGNCFLSDVAVKGWRSARDTVNLPAVAPGVIRWSALQGTGNPCRALHLPDILINQF
jgi:hypothetical protein